MTREESPVAVVVMMVMMVVMVMVTEMVVRRKANGAGLGRARQAAGGAAPSSPAEGARCLQDTPHHWQPWMNASPPPLASLCSFFHSPLYTSRSRHPVPAHTLHRAYRPYYSGLLLSTTLSACPLPRPSILFTCSGGGHPSIAGHHEAQLQGTPAHRYTSLASPHSH